MTTGEHKMLVRGVAAGTIMGVVVGLMLALLLAIRPVLFRL
jgi:tetrahydromethanopterin S-methyltransferase subunit F